MAEVNDNKYLWECSVASTGLLNALGELVYIMDVETHELLFMNTSAQNLFCKNGDYLGCKCYEVLQNQKEPCPYCPIKKLTYGQFYNWEFTNAANGHHYLLKDQLLDWNGRKAHLEIAFDVTAQMNEHTALLRALEGERMVLECVQTLGDDEIGLDRALQNTLEKLGSFLQAERAYIFHICGDKMDNSHEWCAPGITPQIHKLQNLDVSLIERWRTVFSRQSCMILSDLETIKSESPDEYMALHARGITSLVAAPLFGEKKNLIGYFGVDNPSGDMLQNIQQLLLTLQHFIMVSYSRAEEHASLLKVSYHDSLTGLYNRNRYISDINTWISSGSVGIVYLDINGMKEYNDQYGHDYGDQLLIKCADFMRHCFEHADGYRIGGDEFIIIWKGCSQEDFMHNLLRLEGRLALTDDLSVAVGCQWEDNLVDLPQLINQADQDMYVKKKQYYLNKKSASHHQHKRDNTLQIAIPDIFNKLIEEHRFLVYLQPKVSFADQTLIGAEALVRLNMNGEILFPDSFILPLEEAGQIAQLDLYVFSTVCDLLSRWQAQGLPLIPIAVNFSRHSLLESDFILQLTQICLKYKVSHHLLEIEITESAKGLPGLNFNHFMHQLRDAGFTVALDDFGALCSTVSMLAFNKFDVLKFDKSLTADIVQNKRLQVMLDSIVQFSKQVGAETVAEGVETEEQFHVLKRLGIKQAQGYLCGHPVSVQDYEKLYFFN